MKAVYVGLVILCALFAAMVSGGSVTAVNWEVERSDSTSFDTSPYCPTYRREQVVIGYGSLQQLCVLGANTRQVATFYADGSEHRLAVRYPLDSGFRSVDGLCRGNAGCAYNEESDVVVSRSSGSVRVFKNFMSRVHFSLENSSFSFDPGNPEYVLSGSIGALALSANGRWLVIEVKNQGIETIDLENFSRRQILSLGPQYGFGRDPVYELAVTNDGQHVALMGENAGFLIVHVTSDCQRTCDVVSGSTADFIASFNFASHPRFDASGKRLSFYAASYGQGSRRVIMHPPGYDAPSLEYLALGDSFTSGEGETSDQMYQPGTNDSYEKCHVSIRSYPFLLARWMEIPTTLAKSVACAGAKLSDVIGKSVGYFGQGDRLGKVGLDVTAETNLKMKVEAVDTFQPGRTQQADFVQRYEPRVITVGVGGNDAGFMAKLKTCAMPDLCEWAEDPNYRHASGIEIQSMFEPLRDLYTQLLSKSSRSLIYAIGYPRIIEPTGICDPITTTLLTYGERIFMNEGVTYLNRVIKAAAESVGVVYIDIERSLEGSLLCSGSLVQAVNGLRVGDDLSLGQGLPMLKLIGNESFHPTPFGHELMALQIRNHYGDLRLPRVCGCGAVPVPPPLPQYWGQGIGNYRRTQTATILDSPHISPSSPVLKVNVDAGYFEPNSQVIAEIHSHKLELGTVTTASDGSIKEEILINGSLREGHHTLHLYGSSTIHEPIDLYQIISYGEPGSKQNGENLTAAPKINDTSDYTREQGVLGAMSEIKATQSVTIGEDHKNSIAHPGVVIAVIALSVCIAAASLLLIKTRVRTNSSQDPGG